MENLELPNRKRRTMKPERTVPRERVMYLWKRVRQAAKTIGRLTKMSKDIALLGSSKKTYTEKKKKVQESKQESDLKTTKNWFLIIPKTSKFLKIWSVLLFLILLYTLTVTPYLVCFIENVEPSLDYFNLFVDIFFCFDIMVNMCLAYKNNEGVLVTKKGEIVKHYLKTWFFIDLVSSIPFQFIEQRYIKNNYNKLFRLLRLPRLYKLFKVFRMNRLIGIFKKYSCVKKFLHIIRDHSGILNLFKFSITVTILVHIMGCLWYFTAKYNDFNPDTWVTRHGYINSDTTTLYITSIYFVFTTLTTVGYGDIVAFTTEERIFALIIMSFGSAFYSYTISNLSTIMASIDSRTLNMKARISALNEFSKATKLPEDLKQRIKSHILLNYEENIFSWFDLDALMNELPSNLRNDVSLQMYHSTVSKIFFFQDKDPGFISYMVPKLRSISLQPGDTLYKEHDYPDEVYFMTRGKVNLLISDIAFKTYVEGSYFGEVEILENKTRSCTVKAHKDGADFLVLSKQNFLKTLEEFPKIAEELKETAKIRAIKNQEAKEAVLKLGNNKSNGERRSKVQTNHTSITTDLVDDPSSCRIERMKSKSVSMIREKNRKMWQQMKQKHEEQAKPPAQVPVKNKTWDLMFSSLFKRKTSVSTSARPTDVQKQEIEVPDDKLGLLKKAVTMHPAQPSYSKTGRGWNIVRKNINRIRLLPNDDENKEEGQKEKLDWLLDDANVDSPLGSDRESKTKNNPKLLLLKTLNTHLAQHNLRMQYKINVAKKAFGLLKARQGYIKTQIENMYQSVVFEKKGDGMD
jgi:CRP-like cAMP-binding protein